MRSRASGTDATKGLGSSRQPRAAVLSSWPGAVSTLSGDWALAITVLPIFLFRGENQGPGPGGPHPPPPCGLTLSRESSMETAGGETSSTTRAATGPPQRSESGPALPDARSPATPTGPLQPLLFKTKFRVAVETDREARAEETDRGCRTTSLVPGGGPGAPSHSLG